MNGSALRSSKHPWYHHREGELIRFGGVYHPLSGCAIVTTAAQPEMRTYSSQATRVADGPSGCGLA